jgi:cytochrome P450
MESSLAIVAGSDTTGTAMANAFFYFIEQPNVFTRLRAELDEAAAEGHDGQAPYDVEIEESKLANLPYLNAVINEVVRLQPALPNGAQRLPPKNGGPVMVAGQYVFLACSRR